MLGLSEGLPAPAAGMGLVEPMRVKVLVLPVYRRHWMYHAWLETEFLGGAAKGKGEPEAWWRQGTTLQDKVQALSVRFNQSVGGAQSCCAL